MNRNKGLSVIELVVVVGIAGIIAVMSLVSTERTAVFQLDSDTRKIANDLCWAREMAVSLHDDFIVVFDSANENYTIYKGSIVPTAMRKRQQLKIDIVSIIPAPEQIAFYFPAGSAQAKQISLGYRGRTGTIDVFGETGYVKIQ
jgi:Tfp pilus assembly protein FimT